MRCRCCSRPVSRSIRSTKRSSHVGATFRWPIRLSKQAPNRDVVPPGSIEGEAAADEHRADERVGNGARAHVGFDLQASDVVEGRSVLDPAAKIDWPAQEIDRKSVV